MQKYVKLEYNKCHEFRKIFKSEKSSMSALFKFTQVLNVSLDIFKVIYFNFI